MRSLHGLILLATLGGCYSPNLSGKQHCTAEGKCADGLTCASDGLCYSPGKGPVGDGGFLGDGGNLIFDFASSDSGGKMCPPCSGATPVCDGATGHLGSPRDGRCHGVGPHRGQLAGNVDGSAGSGSAANVALGLALRSPTAYGSQHRWPVVGMAGAAMGPLIALRRRESSQRKPVPSNSYFRCR